MALDPTDPELTLAAGDFSSWMDEMEGALRGDRGSDVPCDGCTACCTSSQFVHIGPDEVETLDHIPADLVFPAPRLPVGHVLLGYDERGHCPMLIDNRCSIYEHRPRTCRTYDCRVLSAAGLEGDDDKGSIAQQARRWRFSFPTRAARAEYDALGAAAAFLDRQWDVISAPWAPKSATQIAVLAVQVHHVFLRHDEASGVPSVVDPDPEVVRTEVLRVMGATDAT
jgi:hypothetical protein